MRWGAIVLAVTLLIALVWVSGCADVSFGQQKIGDFGSTKEEQKAVEFFKGKYGDPLTNSGPPRFLEPMVTTGLVNNTPVNKVTKFSKDTGSIFFWVFYDNFRKGDTLTLTWTYNGKTIISLQREAGGDFGRAFGEFLKPDKGWATGTHTITISGSGTSATATFEIIDGATQTVPLPYAQASSQAGMQDNLAAVPTQQSSVKSQQDVSRSYPDLSGEFAFSDKQKVEMDTGALSRAAHYICPNGEDRCNLDYCHSLLFDNGNCGRCGNKCTDNQNCMNGTCSCVSPFGGQEMKICNGKCSDTMRDADNCGSCGNKCSAGQMCNDGNCGPCIGSNHLCNGRCVYDRDVMNCGQCGNQCPLPQYPNTVVSCSGMSGSCWQDCLWGYNDCNHEWYDGCEAYVLFDANNCGLCGSKCPAGTQCAGGRCLNVMTDSDNCGQFGHKCADGEVCHAGTCAEPSNAPPSVEVASISIDNSARLNAISSIYEIMRKDAYCRSTYRGDSQREEWALQTCNENSSTCYNLLTDPDNCGSCGNVCPSPNIPNMEPVCVDGECNPVPCKWGFRDCNKDLSDGCEVNYVNDPRNCGECGHICPAGAASCCGTFCTDLQNDRFNCGSCNNYCHGTEVCQQGTCQDVTPDTHVSAGKSCPSGQLNCWGTCRDLSSDRNNCGFCGIICQGQAICDAGVCRTPAITIPGEPVKPESGS